MNASISPAANSVDGRVLPSLQPVAMVEVMRGFPVVEDLVAVLDWREECCK